MSDYCGGYADFLRLNLMCCFRLNDYYCDCADHHDGYCGTVNGYHDGFCGMVNGYHDGYCGMVSGYHDGYCDCSPLPSLECDWTKSGG